MLSIFCSLPQHTICFIMWYYNFTAMWCDLSAGRNIMGLYFHYVIIKLRILVQ